jgi:hypothetical protein
MIIYRLRIFALPALLLAITNAKASTCDPTTVNTTHQVDVTCYGAAPNTTTDSAPAWRLNCMFRSCFPPDAMS